MSVREETASETSSSTRELIDSSGMVVSHPALQMCGALLQSPAVMAALRARLSGGSAGPLFLQLPAVLLLLDTVMVKLVCWGWSGGLGGGGGGRVGQKFI